VLVAFCLARRSVSFGWDACIYIRQGISIVRHECIERIARIVAMWRGAEFVLTDPLTPISSRLCSKYELGTRIKRDAED